MKRLLLLLSLCAACTPKLPQEEVVEALLKKSDHGLLAGYDVGDSWERIKADHDAKLYTVRDEKGFEQLRHDLSDPGEEGWFLSFGLEGDKPGGRRHPCALRREGRGR